MQTLIFTHGPIAGRRVDVKGDELTVGRKSTNDVVLEDPLVSRIHAILLRKGGAVLLEDLGSHNGTYVNGERVMSIRRLDHGDLVQIGSARALFEDATLGQTDEQTLIERGGVADAQSFTERQLQVLRLAARGLSNKDIAERLAVSERTVKAYLSSAFDKLGVSNRSGAIMTALRLGLIEVPSDDLRD